MTLPTFLLFYFAKTAKTAEFTGKPRISGNPGLEFFLVPKFGFSDQNGLGIRFQTCWNEKVILFCDIV